MLAGFRSVMNFGFAAPLWGALLMTMPAFAGISILNDGADGASAKIGIQSAITRGDLAAFEVAVDRVSRTAKTRINAVPFITVELDSPGGDVVEAIGIGRAIYAHSAMTLVRPGRECVSACVFILMAGAVRTPTETANIGVHRPLLVSWRNMDYAQARAKYDGLMEYLRQYFRDLGVSDAAYDIMMRTDSNSMRYFSADELEQFQLRGESPAWKERYAVSTRQTDERRREALVAAPELPKIDQSYRYVVFMPGDLPVDERYFAGVHIPNLHFVWDSLDEGAETLAPDSSDLIGDLKALYRNVLLVVGPNWWLLALVLFELMRGRSPRRRPGDQWRLAPLDAVGFSPASVPESGRAWPGRPKYGGSG